MATQPVLPRNSDLPGRPVALRPEPDPFQLRPLPLEDVFFHCKKIDNSRLVREPDPAAGRVCWKTIAGAGVLVLLLGLVAVPNVAGTLAGYRLEALRAEERRLLDEQRVLNLEEARLLSPERLGDLAVKLRLVTPSPGQVQHLDGKDGAVAMVK